MAAVMVYITTHDTKEAERIGSMLVEKRLAACANIVEGMKAIFWWEGRIQSGTETILIIKTKESLVIELTHAVKEIHSYECPCVVAFPIISGNPEFIKWINESTREAM